VPRLAPLEHEQLPDPLLVVGARVEHVRVVVHHALVDTEQVDAPSERVGAGLEDVREELALLVGRVERDLGQLDGAVLHRRRQVLHDRVEQPVGAEAARGHAAHDGEDATVVRAVLERRHDLVVGDLVAIEVALHQRLGDLGDLVHELLAVLLRAG
jgi:phosphoenolpyruvate-protein kinase (PTS system EI component)